MLDVAGLSVRYGKHLALADAAFSVRHGEIVVLLGANGAGKSSCLKALGRHGCARPRSTHRARRRLSSAGLPPHEVVERGLVLVPEDRGIFAELDVQENLLLGAYQPPCARRTRRPSLSKVPGSVSPPGRAPAPDRPYHERRRAADAGASAGR